MHNLTAAQIKALSAAFMYHGFFRDALVNPPDGDLDAYKVWRRMRDEKIAMAGLPNPFEKL